MSPTLQPTICRLMLCELTYGISAVDSYPMNGRLTHAKDVQSFALLPSPNADSWYLWTLRFAWTFLWERTASKSTSYMLPPGFSQCIIHSAQYRTTAYGLSITTMNWHLKDSRDCQVSSRLEYWSNALEAPWGTRGSDQSHNHDDGPGAEK